MLDSKIVRKFIREHVDEEFHAKRRVKISSLKIDTITKRKNPYLFKAKGFLTSDELVSSLLDALLSSGEETSFGDFLEKIAIFTAEQALRGYKSGIKGIDLEFNKDKTRYLVTIKSGPYWANSGQKNTLKNNFKTASQILRTSGGLKTSQITCIEGCCYGNSETKIFKDNHYKLCGQDFWTFISDGNEKLYLEILEEVSFETEKNRILLNEIIQKKREELTLSFKEKYSENDNKILWDRLLIDNSGSRSNFSEYFSY